MNIKKHIPNTITSLNALSGCVGCVCAFEGSFHWVVFFVILSGVFDFLDGFSARILKAYSPIGKELDSLADLISFGMVPSISIFSLLSGWNVAYPSLLEPIKAYVPFLGFLIAIFSALRLAKFNIDERQTHSFIGLATPANAMFWVSLCAGVSAFTDIPSSLTMAIIMLVFVFSYLMISEIPMFSLKGLRPSLKGNGQLITVLIVSLLAIFFLKILGIAIGVLCYICICILPLFGRANKAKTLD